MGNILDRLARWAHRSNASEIHLDEDPEETVAKPAQSQLFYCADCETTFISREMTSCPRCAGSVEDVPSERDLDRFHVH